MTSGSGISSLCLWPLEDLSPTVTHGTCAWAVRLPDHCGQRAWLNVVVLAVAGDDHHARSAADAALVDTMAASALPIERKTVPQQDPNEIAELHAL